MFKNVDWEHKLTSRRFLMAIAAVIIALLYLFNVAQEVIERVGAVLAALITVMVYIKTESDVDVARAKTPVIELLFDSEEEPE